jgi:sodium-dependent dicarboxylate transporter 2/3/5
MSQTKSKVGFFTGSALFFIILFLPPSPSMYLSALETVLRHSHQDVIDKLLDEANLTAASTINLNNLHDVLSHTQKITVTVPSDFNQSGEKGIRLATENTPRTQQLKQVIELQTRGLKHTLALAILMAIWWMTEALPIVIVALLPMILLPVLSIAHVHAARLPGYFVAFTPYMHRLVVLFLGGFTIAEAMKRWNLHERIALHFIAFMGVSTKKIIFGLMLATALLSMFISNTATAAMMMPIALALLLQAGCQPEKSSFGTALMLSIAYAASIGGIGTLIGTPPNLVLAGFAEILLNIEITFQDWLAIGMPLVVVLLPLTWWIIIAMNPPEVSKLSGSKETVKQKIKALGKLTGGERNTCVIFMLTAFLWTVRSGFSIGQLHIPGWTTLLNVPWVDDSVIAMIAVLLFYITPTDFKRWEFTLDWKTNLAIPWGTLLLFGGGITIGKALQETGAARFIAMNLINLKAMPVILILTVIVFLAKFLSEITSNTATTTMLMPVIFAAGLAMGLDPLSLMIAAAVATSLVFMLPVATPPNAIVYATGYVRMAEMIRTGFFLQVVSALILIVLLYLVLPSLSSLVTF